MLSRNVRLQLEELEPRVVPDAMSFIPASGNWSVIANWYNDTWLRPEIEVQLAGHPRVPGPNDRVTISDGKTCNVDVGASVDDLSVQGSLNVNNNLTVAVSAGDPGSGGTLTVGNANGGGGAVTVADGKTLTCNNIISFGTITDNSTIDVVPDNSPGTGTVSLIGTSTFNIGSTDNNAANATLDTNSLIGGGTINVGSPTGGGTSSIDAVSAQLGGAVLNLGTPNGGGGSGEMTVSTTMTVDGASTLNVGSASGAGGSLVVYSLTANGASNVNSNGAIEVQHDGAFGGTATVAGGVITADNIDAFTGAGVTINGGATITNGPLTGNLVGEINASFTFSSSSSVTLGTGATLGGGTFNIDGPLTVDTGITLSAPEFVLQNGLLPGGKTATGSIGGGGSISWYDNKFDWQGGTIGGLAGGGFTIQGQADFLTSGSDPKTLSTTLTNIGPSTVNFDGTGSLTITSTGHLINYAPYVVPMELSLPTVSGFAPGMLTNNGYLTLGGTNPITISAPLDNTATGVIDGETGAGPVTLSDTSGTSTLNGSIDIKGALTISGTYGVTTGLTMSGGAGMTLTGTLTIAGGTAAELDNVILTGTNGGAGTITGAGDLSTSGYFDWIVGTVNGSGKMTVGPAGTLYLMGYGVMGRDLDVDGVVKWLGQNSVTFDSGTEVHNETGGLFDYEGQGDGYIPTFLNDGTLELGSSSMFPLTVGTFTQSSEGTLQCDLAGDSSYGALNVTGTATLDGTLDASLQNGYQPASGTVFDVLNFGSSSGQFATVDPQDWNVQYNPNSVDLVSS